MTDDVVKNNISIKLADFDDSKGLHSMVESNGGVSIFRASFGQYNFATMIENSCVSLVAIENNETNGGSEINYVSFMSVNDCSSLTGDSLNFSTAINALQPYVPVTENNSLFVNFWCLDDRSTEKHNVGIQIIKKTFSICSHVDFIMWFCPVNYVTSDFIDRNFSSINLAEFDANSNVFKGFKVLFLHRSNFLPKLMVREAQVEDNDDLVPILRRHNPDVLVGQENFFLADLIQSQDENNRFFVGLCHDEIVGMLATSMDVNVSLIIKLFDISAFSDIIIAEEEKPPPPPLVINIVGDLRLVDTASLEDIVQGLGCVFVNGESLVSEIARQKAVTGAFSLSGHLQGLLAQRGRDVPLPGAFVVFGYPCCENDALDQLHSLLHEDLDVVIELSDAAAEEGEDEDEEDAFLQQHLDGLEVLREQYFQLERSSQQAGGAGRSKALWRKLSIDSELHEKSENMGQLSSEVSRILDLRAQRVEEQRAKESEKPPLANAFALTVFCLEEAQLSRSEDLLRVAFEEHPHHNYCLFMVPNNKPPSELTRAMTYVKTRPGLSFDQSMYIMHRSYFLAHEHLRVQRLTGPTLTRLDKFLGYMRDADRQPLMDSATAAVAEDDVDLRDNPGEVTFLVQVGNTTVGVVQLSRKILTGEDASWFRANYQLDSLVNFDRHRVRCQAVVTQWILDPVYSRWARHVLRDIMRQCGKTLLYYHCARDYTPPKEVLEEFTSINPRRRMQQQLTSTCEPTGVIVDLLARPTTGALGSECPLYCITKMQLFRPKEVVAKRIVVIGGSAHSYAVLETLLSVPYIVFPNVYLVMDRLPAPLRLNSTTSTDFLHSASDASEAPRLEDDYTGMLSPADADFPTENELYALGFAHKVNLVRGHLTDIDRENRAVVVSDEVAIEYDVLVISSSTQDNTCRKLPTVANMHSAKCADAGIFQLGSPSADLLAVRWIRKRYSSKMEPIVIYGTVIRAFTAVAQLLRSGVAESRVVVVLQDSESFINEIEDSSVADKLVQVIKLMGVRVFWDHTVVDVGLSRTGFVQHVDISYRSGPTQPLEPDSDGKESDWPITDAGNLRIPCVVLLCCNFSTCDRDVFSAINDSGLVFDGGLVVDASFTTVDPCIYAAADFTRFSRIYKDALSHIRFNPREVGSYVALKLLAQHLDPSIAKAVQRSRVPTAQAASRAQNSSIDGASFASLPSGSRIPGTSSTHRHQQALPAFILPRTTYADLPGDMHFVQSSLPKQPEEANYLSTPPPLNLAQSRAAFGALTEGVSMCSLKTTYLGMATEFVYLGSSAVEVRNLRHIPGKHEAFLNSAMHAYKKGLVPDWISFFRGEWACVLYHDHCADLLAALRESLKSDKGMVMILSRVFERAENTLENQQIDDFRRGFIGPHGEHLPESTARTTQAETMAFLKEHKATLSQYYVPQQSQQNNQ